MLPKRISGPLSTVVKSGKEKFRNAAKDFIVREEDRDIKVCQGRCKRCRGDEETAVKYMKGWRGWLEDRTGSPAIPLSPGGPEGPWIPWRQKVGELRVHVPA